MIKNRLLSQLIVMFLVGLTACQTEETDFYDEPSVTMTFNVGYHPLDIDYRICIDGVPFRSGMVYMPLSSMRPDSTQEAHVEVQPLDNHGYPIGTASDFTVNLKPDTSFTMIHAVNDQPRIMTGGNKDDFFTVRIYPAFIPEYYKSGYVASQSRAHGITFNEEKLALDWQQVATFYKGRKNTGTLKFYVNNTRGREYPVDVYFPETEDPLKVIENYTFDENVLDLPYFQPLGGEVQWFTEENKANTLNFGLNMRILGSTDFQFLYYYRGELLSLGSNSNYAVKGWEQGEAAIIGYKTDRMNSKDTIEKKELFRGETSYKELDFLFDGSNVTLNRWEYGDPADRQSAFFRISTGIQFDQSFNAYEGNHDLELWIASTTDGYTFTPTTMIERVTDIPADIYSDPIEVRLKDYIPEDLWNKGMSAGQLELFDPNTFELTEDGKKVYLAFQIRVYKAGTSEELGTSNSYNLEYLPGLFTWSADYCSLLFPVRFSYKGYYLQRNRNEVRMNLNQGEW